MEDEDHHWTTEDCILSLSYAWYHVIGCSLLLAYLYSIGKTQHFEAGHNFGIFAMLCDYGIMYLTRGTRTLKILSYYNYDKHKYTYDTDNLHGIGTFLFFAWFDYLGSFALLVFARNISDVVATGKLTKSSIKVVLQQTIMWWTAPFFTMPDSDAKDNLSPPLLQIDDRTVVLSRSSPKFTYLILFVVFSVLLNLVCKISKRQYIGILVSAFATGYLHHVALYYHGMRYYDSYSTLFLTLATEWPALLCGEALVRTFFHRYSKSGRYFMLTVLLAIMMRNFPNDEQIAEFLISVLPGQHMQTFAAYYMWAKTCYEPPHFLAQLQGHLQPKEQNHLPCVPEDDDSIWVISTPAKSGAVLSAKILLDIASECNFCLAVGTRDAAGIPGPGTHVPSYGGKLLHALMDMDEWPAYVEEHSPTNTSRCITITRDPLRRLRSFYTYSRSGGEHWVRYETDIMGSLRKAPTLKDSVELFWGRVGKDYLVSSHTQYLKDKQRGCHAIKFEDLTSNYEATIQRMLRFFGIPPNSASERRLVQTLKRHDRSNPTVEDEQLLIKDMHVSSKKFDKGMLDTIDQIFLQGIKESGAMIRFMQTQMENNFTYVP